MTIATSLLKGSPIPQDPFEDLVAHSMDPAVFGDLLDKTCVNVLSVPSPASTSTSVTCYGRYEVVRKLGEGGMGAVYLARDTATGQQVALKVLSDKCRVHPDAFSRFEKEARLLEEAHNPHIANMLDLGTEGETRFLVMEYVDGCDLRKWLARRGSLDEATALEIVGDLCRALASVHSRGMVHRDIKPENVLLSDVEGDSRPLVKLTDFGLARHIDQSESLKLTQTGALLGTPYYMAPEQFKGTGELSAATDVYALGITLFELLAGRRPFQGSDPIKLATAHCFDAPPDLRQLCPHLSDGASDLVRRTLAKNPANRPPDAACLLEEIVRLQSGRAAQLVLHPTLPEHDPAKLLVANFEWLLESSPEALWPYISNTDRFNQAAGIPAVTYEMVRDEQEQTRKYGTFRMAGMNIRWEEHPFEWVEGRRFSILREFPAGPFVWFLSTIEFAERPEGGTLLKHHVKILPRGMTGRLLATLEVGVKGKRNLDRIYRRIDATVSTHADHVVDHFQPPTGIARVQRLRLQRCLQQLREAGTGGDVTAVLEDLMTNSAPQDLARIRPYAIARRFGLPERSVVDACLQGVRHGLLTMHWDLICPSCRRAADARQTLREINQHAHCAACQLDFKVEFGSSIELVFRAHPEVRQSDSRLYCNGGPGNFPHVAAQVRLEPGEQLLLNMNLDAGSYVLRGPRLPYAIPIVVDSRSGARHAGLRCLPGTGRQPVTTLLAGHQQLTIENSFSDRQLVRIERDVRRSDALTAAEATSLPVFRQLFPQETLAPGQLVQLATTNFLALRLDGLDQILEELGDAGAYPLIRDFQQITTRRLSAGGGATIEEQTGLVLASFAEATAAIESARSLVAELAGAHPQHSWSLSGALHRGSALVTSERQGISYFGSAVHETVRLAGQAPEGCLLLTQEAWSEPGIATQTEFADAELVDLASGDGSDRTLRQLTLNFKRANSTKSPLKTKD